MNCIAIISIVVSLVAPVQSHKNAPVVGNIDCGFTVGNVYRCRP